MKLKADYANIPQWRVLTVKATLPEELKCLDEISHNMWWVWNYEARNLFRDLAPQIYEEVKHNPVMLLERLSYKRKEEIMNDKALMKRIKDIYTSFRTYMDVKPDHSHMLAFGSRLRTRSKKGASASWFSGSRGSPPSTERPFTYGTSRDAIIWSSTSRVNGFPAAKSHASALKHPAHLCLHPDTKSVVRTPVPFAMSHCLISA